MAYSIGQAVFAILLNEKGEILLMNRQNTSLFDGFISVPSGRVRVGDEFGPGAIIRELKEEVGIEVFPEDVEFVSDNNMEFVGTRIEDDPFLEKVKANIFYNCSFYFIKAYTGTPTNLEPEQAKWLKWANPYIYRNRMIPFVADKLSEIGILLLPGNEVTEFKPSKQYTEQERLDRIAEIAEAAEKERLESEKCEKLFREQEKNRSLGEKIKEKLWWMGFNLYN